MATPAGPVTLSPEQIEDLNRRLGTMRHDINNNLSLIVAAAELIKFNPASAQRMSTTLAEQPAKITDHLQKFTAEFEKALGVARS
jgi:Cu/Ag efflux protein CusF